DGIRGGHVTGVQTCALPICPEGAVGGSEGVGDAGGAEPGGDSAATTGEEGAAEEEDEARGGAAVEGGDEEREPGGHAGGQVRERSEERRVGKEWSAWVVTYQ